MGCAITPTSRSTCSSAFFVPFIWMLLTFGWAFFERSFSRGETTYGMMAIPVYPVKGVIVVAAGLLLLQAIAIVIRAVQALGKETPA